MKFCPSLSSHLHTPTDFPERCLVFGSIHLPIKSNHIPCPYWWLKKKDILIWFHFTTVCHFVLVLDKKLMCEVIPWHNVKKFKGYEHLCNFMLALHIVFSVFHPTPLITGRHILIGHYQMRLLNNVKLSYYYRHFCTDYYKTGMMTHYSKTCGMNILSLPS